MTTTASQEAFLLAYHAEHPTVTSDVFAHGRTPDGRSSYEMLRDAVRGSARVLDLGCGDELLLELLAREEGRRLAGVDLSPHSLAVARRRPALAGARLEAARAQRLPFGEGEFDACVSHMALMLMSEIEQVAGELARVLSPGGALACVVGGGAVAGEGYDAFLRLLRTAIDRAPAAQRIPSLGDRRSRTREGLGAILSGAGFVNVRWETVPVDIGGPLENLWSTVSGVYDLGPLDPPTVDRLADAFRGEAAKLARPDGHVPCGFNIHVVTAHRG
ncbi:methyltransferase domain-containing protein [Streptomyces sp. J2-1]|uniref:class I SAM-dependent methyltransferase n=1 Tax=Streptomyces corallincola TaxID=2851888 RepID=UPI001C381EE2|nr:class I SAM-dependent methyltransferase [Streptomyces corallincola]MBV2352883.1 methyltransferase domain-containing protein [Streptomyces corallincola]